ncbi:MAG: hypothetical protein O2852_02675 [Bacteroidetes bacterium]|nr:hypothetical protein [Bacteroidota bacterium]MDA0980242.1 hypothetical protein [Bacteroidota bacterium]
MKKLFYILIGTSLLLTLGCKTETVVDVAVDSNVDGNVEINVDSTEFVSTTFTFKDVKIMGDTLIANVQYGGGCGHHKFEIKQNGFLMKSLPPKQPIQIIHLSTVDPCRALINVDLKFDISRFRGTPHGTTVLLLKNWTSDIIYSY